jgi:hypothetical protein
MSGGNHRWFDGEVPGRKCEKRHNDDEDDDDDDEDDDDDDDDDDYSDDSCVGLESM